MAFFDQKIRTLFTRFDMDKNAMIEVEDFNQWSAKLAQIGGLNAERSAALQKSLLAVWNVFFLPADTNNDGSVEVPELLTHMRAVNIFLFYNIIKQNFKFVKSFQSLTDNSKRASIEATLPLIFDAIDTNADGGIEVVEFTAYFSSLGLTDAAFANTVFQDMDANHDGSLSREEFAAFGNEFFLSQDAASPSRHFFGPLVA